MIQDPYLERHEDLQHLIQNAIQSGLANTWTALPGRIESVDLSKMIVSVQPTVQSLFTGANQQQQWTNLPVLPDVPIYCPRGGDYVLTFPIKAGDDCLVVFSSRCIDNWWDQGGVQSQRELRMHDLSDGFALVGPYSQKSKVSNVSANTVQLRTNDGQRFVEIDNDGKTITVSCDGNIVKIDTNAKTITLQTGGTSLIVNDNDNSVHVLGNLRVSGAILAGDGAGQQFTLNGSLGVTGSVTAGQGGPDQVGLQTHVHPTTAPPVPGT